MRFRTHLVRAVAVAAMGAVTSGLIGLLFAKNGVPGGSLLNVKIGGDYYSITERPWDALFWWRWLLASQAAPAPQGTANRPEPKLAEAKPVEAKGADARPAPAPTPPERMQPEMIRRETHPIQPKPATDSRASVAPASPTSAPAPAADEPTVIRLGAPLSTGQRFEEHLQDNVVALEGYAESHSNATATLSTVSGTGTVGSLAPHGPGAVVVEEGCGTVVGGRYVAPSPPHGDLICTVSEEVSGTVTTTAYSVRAEQ